MFEECWIEEQAIGTGVERSGTEVPIAARRQVASFSLRI